MLRASATSPMARAALLRISHRQFSGGPAVPPLPGNSPGSSNTEAEGSKWYSKIPLLSRLFSPAGSTTPRPKRQRQQKHQQQQQQQQQQQRDGDGGSDSERRGREAGAEPVVLGSERLPQRLLAGPPEWRDIPVARLATGLRPIPFSAGVQHVDQFDQYFKKVEQPENINWDVIPPFVTSSHDKMLLDVARANGCNVVASTSSSTALLSQLHILLHGRRLHNLDHFSPEFRELPPRLTRAASKPAHAVLRNRAGVWGIDRYPGRISNNVLLHLGKSMERMLTMEPSEFCAKLIKSDLVPSEGETPLSPREPVIFVKVGKSVVLRSQLDCFEPGLSTDRKVFDLKTRATLPIRMDVANYAKYTPYKLVTRKGYYHSFEREWFDMARATFLKYSLQCRIGQMGGIMVAYHNTEEVFGFEYIPLAAMDKVLYGSTATAEHVFDVSLKVFEQVLSSITKQFSQHHSIGMMWNAVQKHPSQSVLEVFVETLPPPDKDPDKHMPFERRASAVLQVDELPDKAIRSVLARLGLDTEGDRAEVTRRLETAVAPSPESPQFWPPSLHRLAHMASNGWLRKFDVAITLLHQGKPISVINDSTAGLPVEVRVHVKESSLPSMGVALAYQRVWKRSQLVGVEDSLKEAVELIPMEAHAQPEEMPRPSEAESQAAGEALKRSAEGLIRHKEEVERVVQLTPPPPTPPTVGAPLHQPGEHTLEGTKE